ncbi:inorganic pyrophosphatase 1-like [Triticum dicoccoides]|uniref:inorganic pyrophosphatase 1-like n=1 Tax=Triticum dicoccoides TaxID=85692 RepID=UPI000E7B508E|nr:inorganic pyrophosphatase 1-like [Triticum dicoccoides]
MAGVVVVFDFDKTIIDVDSDNWVVDGLGATELFDRLMPTMPWNTLIDTVMGELHAQGRTLRDVADVLRAAPIDPHVVAAIRAAYSLGCDIRVLSDANRFFIETVLDHHGLRGCFSEINTNPSHVDADGRLRIAPHHDFHATPHGCGLGTCPPNMCKGQVLHRIRASVTAADGARKRFIYLGDGRGDYCPSLRLAREDFMMPRKGYPVWDLICENPGLLQAEVHPWSDGKDMEETLLRLISRVLVEESQLLPLDCKLESLPVAVQDGMPMPLGVKN